MIQTVTGLIEKTELGAVLMHEHISCSSLSYERNFGSKWLDKKHLKDLSVQTMKLLKEKYGLGLMVDGTPIDLGRDVLLLKEVSELSGVKIVASTGFYHLQGIETINNSPMELAKWLISECQNGVMGTNVKPGILKCATGELGITKDNQKKLSTMGIVQSQTGLPLFVHCEHRDDVARKQIELLCSNGANIQKIIIGHTAIRPDGEYLESILQKGCYICIDQCHCYPDKLKEASKAILYLCKKGYTNKIVLSNDYCLHSDFCKKDIDGLHLNSVQHAQGFGYVFDKLHDEFILLGGSNKDWITMITKNPIQVLDV